MQSAAHDVGRLSRLTAGCAGVAVAVFGAAALLMSLRGAPPDGLLTDPAAALVPAGLGLLLQVLPVSHRIAGRVVHGLAHLLMIFAAAVGVLGVDDETGPAIATLVAVAAFVLLGHLVRTLHGAERHQRRLVGELEDREKFAATLLQSMNEAVMVMDANYHVIDVNRRWRELTGHGADEPVRFDPPPVPPAGGDWLLPRVDGSTVPVLATVAPIPDEQGAPRAYVATYVDIADRKRAEETLSDHAAELERGNANLREANARLEAALTFKNDLTSMLTHDVAQPISSIASLAELLRADWDDLPDDIRLELATKIDKNTQRLIKMMNDLQLLFRLDMGRVTARRAPVPLREVAEGVAAATACDVRVLVQDDLSALADRGHVTAVLQNLVNNAVAYGSPPIEVSAERQGETVELAVRDHGPGIADELLPNLFGRFMRGAGLGLFIVRHLAEANGGSVRYEQATPKGAKLVVTFELAPV
ncbi:PAS domain S-box-containing protein [Paractinoplanes atraurantiacus]|uniref:Sensor-like histidine kinase SenX3 n=1 Tax=Paractinoplanes atraurantiacus TaxID=1036182 RepID=A0A285F1P3_9ACTN|nr:PAS domain S-box-containing protein [Actinoplanes atraurantiacus]